MAKGVEGARQVDKKTKKQREQGSSKGSSVAKAHGVKTEKRKEEIVEEDDEEETESSEEESGEDSESSSEEEGSSGEESESEEDENDEEEENPKGKGKGRAGSGRAVYQEQSEAENDEENNSDAKPLASKSSKARKKGPSKPVLKVIPDPRDLLLTPPNLDTAALPKNYLKTLLKVRSEKSKPATQTYAKTSHTSAQEEGKAEVKEKKRKVKSEKAEATGSNIAVTDKTTNKVKAGIKPKKPSDPTPTAESMGSEANAPSKKGPISSSASKPPANVVLPSLTASSSTTVTKPIAPPSHKRASKSRSSDNRKAPAPISKSTADMLSLVPQFAYLLMPETTSTKKRSRNKDDQDTPAPKRPQNAVASSNDAEAANAEMTSAQVAEGDSDGIRTSHRGSPTGRASAEPSLADHELAGSEPWVPSVDESTQRTFDSSLREEVDRMVGPHNPLIAPTAPHEEGSTQDAYVAALKELTQAHQDTTTALAKHSQVLAECLHDFNEYVKQLMDVFARAPNALQ
ncbi:hypothetical protein C8Q76DRAFT_791557 [Earliella scabrosa]|nr:hypothetical protein C8Q76DRAFT_791557 [Earliella scabrosa]